LRRFHAIAATIAALTILSSIASAQGEASERLLATIKDDELDLDGGEDELRIPDDLGDDLIEPIDMEPEGAVEESAKPLEPLVPWFPEQSQNVSLSLGDFRQRLYNHNEQIQVQLIGVLLAEQNYIAAKGIFEPSLVTEIEHVRTLRPNNAEQASSQSGLDDFDERNNLFSNGIEALLPSNARVRLGFNVFNLRNNLQLNNPNRRSPEYTTFLGANFTQPLLKDAGKTASLAAIRLAARESEIAFQEYRRQMMTTVASAEVAYWSLFVAQKEADIAQESLALARTIHDDTKKSLAAGRSTEAEVMAAKVAILERESNFSLARQTLFEAGNNLLAFFAAKPVSSADSLPRTATPPRPTTATRNSFGSETFDAAFKSNPDYLRRITQVEVEKVRVAFAINQKRPQLDLKASYGLNGLGNAFDSSLDDIGKTDYPSWSIGVNMRVPLGGNQAVKAQLTAAQARKAQALLGLKEVENQLHVALESSKHQIATAHDSFNATQAAVSLREAILRDERERLEAGRSNIRTVFEVEEELNRSKMTALRALLGIQTARLQMELVSGTVLANRDWEMSAEELSEKTRHAEFNSRVIPVTRKRKNVTLTEPSKPNHDKKSATAHTSGRAPATPASQRTKSSADAGEQKSSRPVRRGLLDKKRNRSN